MPQKRNPGRRRAGARQGRPHRRRLPGPADGDEGPAARLFQGHAGGQGGRPSTPSTALRLAIAAMTGMVEDLEPRAEAMRAAAGRGYSTATDLADWLVRELKLPFREAHHVTGASSRRRKQGRRPRKSCRWRTCRRSSRASPTDVFSVLTSRTRSPAGSAMGELRHRTSPKWPRLVKRLEKDAAKGLELQARPGAPVPPAAAGARPFRLGEPAGSVGRHARNVDTARRRLAAALLAGRAGRARRLRRPRLARSAAGSQGRRHRQVGRSRRHQARTAAPPKPHKGFVLDRCSAKPNHGATKPAMHHFNYKDGVLHAEDVSLARLADEVGTPFYCYSTATLERHYRVLAEAFAGQDALICFAVKANSNQAVLRDAGAPRRRHGRRLRGRAAPRPRRRRARRQDHLRRRRQDARGDGLRAASRASSASTSRASRSCEALSEVAAGLGHTAQRRHPRQSGRRRQTHAKISTGKAENKFGIPYAQARALYAEAGKLPGIAVGRHPHAHRQPDHRAGAVPQRLPADARARRGADARRPRARCISISAAASACPIRTATMAPPPSGRYAASSRSSWATSASRSSWSPAA